MRESKVEGHLQHEVDFYGGHCEKHVSPGRRGVRDRVCLWHHGVTHWIETKAPGKTPKEHQQRDHMRLRALGHVVLVLDTIEKVDAYIVAVRYGLREFRDSRALQKLRKSSTTGAVPYVTAALRLAGLLAQGEARAESESED